MCVLLWQFSLRFGKNKDICFVWDLLKLEFRIGRYQRFVGKVEFFYSFYLLILGEEIEKEFDLF